MIYLSYIKFLFVGRYTSSNNIFTFWTKSSIVNFSILFFISIAFAFEVPYRRGMIIIGSVEFSFVLAPITSLILLIPDFLIDFFLPEAWIEFNAAYVKGSL